MKLVLDPLSPSGVSVANDPVTIINGGGETYDPTSDTIHVLKAGDTSIGPQIINTNSTAAFKVEQNGVKNNVLTVDTTNGRVGINNASPQASLHIPSDPTKTQEVVIGDYVDLAPGAEAYTVFSVVDGDNVPAIYVGRDATHGILFLFEGDAATGYGTFETYGGTNPLIFQTAGNGLVGIGQITPQGKLHIQGKATSTIGLIVQGFPSQTADLQQWQNSSSTVLAKVDKDGSITIKGLSLNTATKTSDYTVTSSDSILLADASSNDVTFTLPTAVGITGRRYTFVRLNTSGNAVTLDPNGAQTINGAATLDLISQYAAYTIASDGSNWYVVSDKAEWGGLSGTITDSAELMAELNSKLTGVADDPAPSFSTNVDFNTHELMQIGRTNLSDSSEPSTPASGGVLYAESGALYYKGSSGTVTMIAPA